MKKYLHSFLRKENILKPGAVKVISIINDAQVKYDTYKDSSQIGTGCPDNPSEPPAGDGGSSQRIDYIAKAKAI